MYFNNYINNQEQLLILFVSYIFDFLTILVLITLFFLVEMSSVVCVILRLMSRSTPKE